MISQAAARLLRALGLLLKKNDPPEKPAASELSTPPWTGLNLRPRRPARCDRGYASPYPTPIASHDPPTYRR